MIRATCLAACYLLVLPASLFAAELPPEKPTGEGLKFFEAQIRPVLVTRCYECHSADAAAKGTLEGELLLDSRDGIRKGGASGAAIVPGDLTASLLVAAIRHDSVEMPPDTKLNPSVISDFEKWVKMGAPDPRDGATPALVKPTIDIEAGREFWSFQPLTEAVPPDVTNGRWVKNEVDHFILARLEEKGLRPGTAASRRTLIRRLYFDLWGLPPTPAEVEAFISDSSPRAYEQLVDRLLDSQHFGERWARHWLDLARFAESNGYAFDKDRPAAFHYRDFVIKAFNEDMPYDKFIQLQIAGDQISPTDYMAQAATGFIAAGPFTSQQTQKERERSRYEQLDDIVGTIGTSMLGLTVGCARCHDHKFDPLPTHDYYRFTACFAEAGFQDFDYDPDPAGTKTARDAFENAHKPLVDARVKYESEQLPSRLAAWEQSSEQVTPQEKLGPWHVIGPFQANDFKAAYNKAFAPEAKIELDKKYDALTWVVQPELKDGQVHNTLKGDNSANYLFRTIEVAHAGPLEISLGRDDAIKAFLNGTQVLAKEVSGGAAADQDKLTLQLKAGRNDFLLKIVNASGPSGFYFKTNPSIPKNVQDILKLSTNERDDKQKQELLRWYGPRDPEWSRLNAAEQEHLAKQPKPASMKIFAARRNGATYDFGPDTRKVYFLARGNSNAKQGLASPGFLQALSTAEIPEDRWISEDFDVQNAPRRPARVALAEWMTDEQFGAGQLLARVIVNRLWQHHLGRGIIATPSDFGSQGTPPTHPALLDYLAAELIEGGWKLKPIHKLIIMSATYRQSGKPDELAMKIDPDNNLWWRRGATRLEAEVIRDTLLLVSGGLDKTMFGKGSLEQKSARRSVYLTVKRSNLIPILQLFDAPDSIQSVGHRDVTTVPPQALAMMNSMFVRELAEKFAERVLSDSKSPPEQTVETAYQLALSRPPSEAECEQMTEFIHQQTASYGGDANAHQRAVADFCQLIFCLNEFVFVD